MTDASQAATPHASGSRTILGHPSMLWGLSTVEMWERFSYYGMRGLLVLFLTSATINGGFGWDGADALRLYGLYTGLVYATPVIGGWLANRVLGIRWAVILGATSMALGHFSLAGPAAFPALVGWSVGADIHGIFAVAGVPLGGLSLSPEDLAALQLQATGMGYGDIEGSLSLAYVLTTISFYAGLILLIVGNGLFKPNMTTLVGHLYEDGDPRKDSAYTIFYMGINLGAFIANLVAGTIGELVGWHYGFSVAGIGMTIGLVMFLWINRQAHFRQAIAAREPQRVNVTGDYALTTDELGRVRVIVILSVVSIMFWAAFEQSGGLLNLIAFEQTDRMLFSFEIPATWFQSLNPLFIVLLAPLYAAFWNARARRGKDPSSGVKFSIALVLIGAAFLLMTLAFAGTDRAEGERLNMLWLVAVYLLMTMGELALSPVGLAAVNKLAPLRFASMLMGVWFLSSAAAGFLAGEVGALATVYGEFAVFAGITATLFVTAALLYVVSPILVRWSVGSHRVAVPTPAQ